MLEFVVIIKDDKASMVDLYPLQRVDDLFTAMSGWVSFSKLDLLHEYLQLQLEESSRQYVTINTHRRLYRYTRLPFEVLSVAGMFQWAMDNLLQGMPHIVAYLDDILISGQLLLVDLSILWFCFLRIFIGRPMATGSDMTSKWFGIICS